jgi:predicted transcriptional regulator
MRNGRAYRLGDLQLEIMKLLWRRGASRVADVHKELGSARFAYTTVATMLRKMEQRGLVSHHEEGRIFYYEPGVSAEEVTRSTMADLVDRVFEGSLADAVSNLLDIRDVGPEELDRLEQLIQERRRRQTLE